jgi:hypothetical protein
MSGTIWLITEDENDYKIVRAVIQKLNLSVNIKWLSPSGKTPGLSRLAAELNQLIAEAQKRKTGNDCIVVLHDRDIHKQPIRKNYDHIQQVCQKHQVKLIIAKDEIEAWLLSDSGICKWLKEPVKTWNGDSRPSDYLASALHKQYRLKYPRHLDKVLLHLAADGINESFQDGLAQLLKAPCVK